MRNIIRIFTGIVFVVSGFVKAVDPVGFSFKLEEYFSPSVLNIPFLEKFALHIAIIVVSVEFVLGILLLIGLWIRKVLFALLIICIFFAFLTFYSAYFNVVTDCGCFGDALKLTPWMSFLKDIVLMALIILMIDMYKNDRYRLIEKSKKFLLVFISIVFLIVIVLRGILEEPYIDFRDYKVGVDLNLEKRKIEENPAVYEVVYTLVNVENGDMKIMTQNEYISSGIWENAIWQVQSGKTKEKLVTSGYDSNVKNFKILDSKNKEITEQILNKERIALIFTYKPDEIENNLVNEIQERLLETEDNIYAVSINNKIIFDKIPQGTMDGTAIKTIARSNPFILILENGKIVTKQSVKKFIR